MGRKWTLRFRILLFFTLIAAGGIAAIAGGLALGYRRLGDPSALSEFLLAGLIAFFALAGLLAWVWLLFDENLARPIERLASDLRARAHAAVDKDIDLRPARHLGDLAPAAAAVAASLAETRGALAEAVARETERIGAENARLAAVLRDVPAGVILCTPAHRIVLYNAQAVALLAGAGELGLDRPLFGLLREGPIRHAHDQLARLPDGDEAVDLLCATADGARVLQGQMRQVRDKPGRESTGYVLTLRDVTADLSAHAERERLLRELIEHIRRPAANLQITLDVLADAGVPGDQRARLQAAVVGETASLVDWITAFGKRLDATATGWWPMADVAASDIADALRATLEHDEVTIEAEFEPLLLRCDGYALVQLLSGAARRFAGRQLRLSIAADTGGAMLELAWDGPLPSVERVDRWLADPLAGGYAAFTGRDALDNHGTEFWPEAADGGAARLRLPIREARAEVERARRHLRAEFYDFDLLGADARAIGDERPLLGLKYVVFDTETTGLAPFEGDEIVQLAAVRIVNRRLLTGESFDTLVDPERPIPLTATRIHRISDGMVAGAPTIAEAGRRFHQFCEDSVLVAHNAPFDMAFLRRHEQRIGARFANPVLDTVLLSAILFGQASEHSLDAIAARLGVRIAEEARHTARGDAEATARIFLMLLPMLSEAGLVTLGETIRECWKHRRLVRPID